MLKQMFSTKIPLLGSQQSTPRDTVVGWILLVLFGAPLMLVPLLFLYWTICNLLVVIGVTSGCWLSSLRY